MRRPRRNIWLVYLIGIALAIGLIWAFLPERVTVTEAVIAAGPFEQMVSEEGKTRAKDKYVVPAPVTGKLMRVKLKPGTHVRAGQSVATILPVVAPLLDIRTRNEAEQRLGAAQADLSRAKSAKRAAKAALESAKTDFNRAQRLVREGAEPRVKLEETDLLLKTREEEYKAAKEETHAAEHAVEGIRATLREFEPGATHENRAIDITSPVSGNVLRVAQESETPLAAGTPILEIGNTALLEVVVDVLSTDAVEVKAGMPVRLEHWGGERPLLGKVRVREPSAFTKVSSLGVEEQRVNIIVDIVSPASEWSGLGDGYRVESKIVTFQTNQALKVPIGALFRDGESWAVFLDQDGRAQKRKIKITRKNDREAIVETGLSSGERVVLYPGDFIAEGTRIRAG